MKKFKVNFINSSYRRSFQKYKKEIMKALEKCYAKGDFVLRDEVDKFEQNLAKFLKIKYAAGVGSGTEALKIAYKSLGLKRGDEVITVSHTFIAPIEEIVHLGGIPVLVDVKEDGLMDVSKIENEITDRTVGIVPVHLSGKVCDMEKILKLAKKYKLWVVEDACQALGAKLNGKMAGTFGDISCFSFIPPKTLGGGGDGGGVATNNKKLYEKILLLRNHWNINQNALLGRQPKAPKIMGWGYNSRLDNIHAAVLNIKIKHYSWMLKRRKEIGQIYNKGLKGLPIKLPEQQEGQIYQEYIIRLPNIFEFKKYMEKCGIELLIRDTTPNYKLKGLGIDYFKLPITDILAKESVRLPTYPELTNNEISYIINSIKKFYGKK
jgi:dTDP-4-amino-4,6-dideoxygalactose transaminase